MRITAVALSLLIALACGYHLTAAEPPPPTWKYSFQFDSVYSNNFADPASGVNLLRNFDSNANKFNVSGAGIDLQYSKDHFGFQLDAGYGQIYQTVGSADPWRGPNRYIQQAFVSYRPLTGSALQVDFGKFYTTPCAEVIDPMSNTNYSRSLLFVLGVPYDHFGIRASIPVTKTFTVGAQMLNGWNNVRFNDRGKALGLTAALTHPTWVWTQTYLGGPEKTDTTQGFRHLMDEVLTFTPRPWIQGYVEVLGGYERGPQKASDYWAGAATSLKFTAPKLPKLSFSPRYEFFNDGTGFTSGTAQFLTEFTGTLEYRPMANLTARAEYRYDHSNQAFFSDRNRENARHDQQTALLAVIIQLKGTRSGIFFAICDRCRNGLFSCCSSSCSR